MATTSFTIYSYYDPEKDKDRLQRETGQLSLDTTESDEALWRQAASAQFLRIQRPPPRFVPAAVSSVASPSEAKASNLATPEHPLGDSLSSWYRTLTTPKYGTTVAQSSPTPTTSKLVTTSKEKHGAVRSPTRAVHRDKGNWFIQKVIQSEAPSAPRTPPPTLADILARSPPPLPSEPKYTPPVWVEIGPANRGFMMLQKGGWNEGEALGPASVRRPVPSPPPFTSANETPPFIRKGKQKAGMMDSTKNRGSRIIKQESHDGFGEGERVEIIDLTTLDSEDYLGDENSEQPSQASLECDVTSSETSDCVVPHGRTALLTPIATVLKLDRLGIGLKAKTAGPYKASVRRVTHNAAALAAHIGAAEDARRRREKFGRGRRGYERQRRKEEDTRRELLAYMNT